MSGSDRLKPPDWTTNFIARHAAASLFIELGWQPKRIQAVMGHSLITMTFDTDGQLFPQGDVSEDMRRLEAAIIAA